MSRANILEKKKSADFASSSPVTNNYLNDPAKNSFDSEDTYGLDMSLHLTHQIRNT